MKKLVYLGLIVFVAVFAALPAYARVFVRGNIWLGPGPYWGPPGYYYPYYPYYPPAPVIVEPGERGYIERGSEPARQNYWYYCEDPKGYYPYVKACPGGWMKVVPSNVKPDAVPPGEEE